MPKVSGMKFEYRRGLLYIPISILYDTSIELMALIDTGSAGTAINVNRFNIDLLSRNGQSITLHGIGGTQDAFVQTVSSVKVGSFSVNEFEVEFCDIEAERFGFEAIIGSNLFDALKASAKVVNLATNIAALCYFLPAGHVVWSLALPLAAANIGGAVVGSRVAITKGSVWIRKLFLVVVCGLIVRLAWGVW